MVKRYANRTGQNLTITNAEGADVTVPNGGIVMGKYYGQFAPPLTYLDDGGEGLDFSSGAPARVIGGGEETPFSTSDKVNPTVTELQSHLTGTDRPNTRSNALGNSTNFDAFDLGPSAPITGTSATNQFTRSSGTWGANTLVNQYIFTYLASDIKTGQWNRITANTATVITADANVFSSANTAIISNWNPIGESIPTGGSAFNYTNIASDGADMWLAPFTSSGVLRLNPVTGRTTTYTHGQAITNGVSLGGAYDGQAMWFSPFSASFIRVGLEGDGSLTTFTHDKGAQAFSGLVFTGRYLFAAPHNSTHIARIDPMNAEITYFAHGAINTNSEQAGFHYYGIAHLGDYIWCAPFAASTIMKFHIPSGKITHIPHNEGDLAFAGVVATSDGVYFIPAYADHIVKVNPNTNAITRYPHNPATVPAYNGGAYDGRRYIYMNDQQNSYLGRFDTMTGSVVRYPLGKGNGSFFGCIYFDNHLFMAPYGSTSMLRIRLPQTGAGGLNVYGRLSAQRIELNLPVYATNAAAYAVLPVGTLYQDANGSVLSVIEPL